MVKEKTSIKELKHQARRHSIKEGIFASGKFSFGDRYISPFAIAINASNSLVVLLSSIAGLLGPLSQMFSSRLIEKYSRKKIILKAIFFESLMWLPLIVISVLFYKGIIVNALSLLLLISFALYIILANLVTPVWFSWMGDIVDNRYRGRWFSKRGLIVGFVSVILALVSAFFLDYFKRNDWIMFGFIILFSLAFISRIISREIFKKTYEPKIKLEKGYYFSFWQFLRKAPKNNFGRFAIFRSLLSLANFISAPLIAVYLLRYLEFNYTTYMIVTLAGAVYTFMVLELWGKFSDKYGNYKTLQITSILIPLIPISWILFSSPIYFVLVPAAIGGIAWAGFNLAASNFIYDNVSQSKRGLAVSYYNMLMGIGIFLGAGIGAILIKVLKTNFIEPLFLIFIIGSIARIIVVLLGIPRIKEVKKRKRFRGPRDLENLVLKEAKPTLIEEVHEIMHIKKYLTTK